MSRWFRMHDEILDNPKVQRLPPVLFKAWVNLLCLASRGGGILPSIDDIAFALRSDVDTVSTWLDDLKARRLIDEQTDGLSPHDWNARQFKSDQDATAAERQARKRARDKEESVTRDMSVMSRPPETDTEAYTEQKEEPSVPSVGSQANATDEPPPEKPKREKEDYNSEFELVWSEWPRNPNESKKIAFDWFRKLSAADREAVLDGAMAQSLWLEEETRSRSEKNRDPPPRIHLSTFISERRFETLLQTRFNRFGKNPWQPTQPH